MESLNENAGPGAASVLVDTLLYEQVLLHYRDDEISGAYQEGPPTTVRIHRVGERAHKNTPIGTRTAASLRATIDGRAITLNPGRARLLKRSYRVGIEFDDRVLTLSAKGLEDSFLLDGPADHGDNSFGVLTRSFGGGVEILWSIPFKFMGKEIQPPTPSHDDVLVGMVAADAFGTGGLSASTVVMGAVASIFP